MNKIFATNRKANFEYHLEDKFEAGLVLKGSEVKSIREKKASINEAFVGIKQGELFLINSHINKYNKANIENHSETRYRKILLHKSEVNKLLGKLKTSGYTIIPLKLYLNDKNKIKIEISLARGKKQHDKRESLKTRDWDREKARLLKKNNS
ncbi:MAG: SsrA-binding protein SmpB [Rickettsiales bacterium]|nr:SsrA-binding protein SmpB [Rickettsiales bacterium]